MCLYYLHNRLQYNLHHLIPAGGRLPRDTAKEEKAPLAADIVIDRCRYFPMLEHVGNPSADGRMHALIFYRSGDRL